METQRLTINKTIMESVDEMMKRYEKLTDTRFNLTQAEQELICKNVDKNHNQTLTTEDIATAFKKVMDVKSMYPEWTLVEFKKSYTISSNPPVNIYEYAYEDQNGELFFKEGLKGRRMIDMDM